MAAFLLAAPGGARLAAAATDEAGASASWRPAELAPPGEMHRELRQMLRDVAAGGAAAEAALGRARRQLDA